VGIITTRVETIVVLTMDIVRRGILIGSAKKLGNGLGGVSTGRKLNGNTTLPTTITRVVGTPQMVFTNLIMIIHVHRIADQPLMSSMAIGRYKNANAANLRGLSQPHFGQVWG
jgi:hypothetical protein